MDNYEIYRIGDDKDNYAVSLATNAYIYDGENSYRKAHPLRYHSRENATVFIDESFQIFIGDDDTNDKHQKFELRRLFQIYDKQIDIFQPKLMGDLPLRPRRFYPTFLSEFSMIDKTYLQTLFLTKKLNRKGLYKYFVRRNGEYYVEIIDDTVPVDPQTRLPPWGLNEFQPWKIIMMKAWLKEKGSIEAMVNAQPYEFIQAFGFPGYRAISIKKQLQHIAESKELKESSKEAKERRIPLDVQGFIVVGKTRKNKKIEEMGLVPNRAGYRITKAKSQNQSVLMSAILDSKNHEILMQQVYKVQSSLPSAWVGEFSIFANSKIHQSKYTKLPEEISHIQSEFFASYQEIVQIFSKFYMVPEYTSNKLSGHLLQDSISVIYNNPNDYYVFALDVVKRGFINLNIDLPSDTAQIKHEGGMQSKRYSYIKYFMARKEDNSNAAQLTGYSYYDGQYVKGYHKSCNRFLELQPAAYYIYFKVQANPLLTPGKKIAININSNAQITNFSQVQPSSVNFSFIMQSALHNYNARYGLKTYSQKKKDEKTKKHVIYISNSFDEIGFGIISIEAKIPTDMMLAMNIHLNAFYQRKLGIVKEAQNHRKKDDSPQFNLVVRQGEAQTVIVERLFRSRQTYEVFPPPQSVDFYHII